MRKLHESIWSDIQDRSTGETTRKEDDVNLLDKDGLYEYLISHYKPVEGIDIKSYIFCGNSYINLCVFIYPRETRYSILLDILNCRVKVRTPYIKRWPANLLDMIYKKYNREDIIDNNRDHMTLITPKEGKGNNQFYIDFLDMILNNVDKPLLKKVINESVWSDIQDRSAGETVRKEDEFTEEDRKDLDKLIVSYANEVVYGRGMNTDACNLDDFGDYIETDNEIKGLNKDKILQYVKDYWVDEVCDDVDGTIEQVQLEYHQDMNESVWSDIQDRSSGELTRKEDDINNLDIDGLYDYIKSKYGDRLFRLEKDPLKRFGIRDIIADPVAYISLITAYNKDNSEKLDHILLSWSFVKISMPFFDKLSERFKVENPNAFRRVITDKDGTCTNQTYIDVIDFFLDNLDNMLVESIWSDIQDRSTGEVERKEDQTDFQKALAIYIEMFASISFNGDYTVGSYPDFKAFMRDFMDNPRIASLDIDIVDLVLYVKDNWNNIVLPTILDTIKKIDNDVNVAVNDIIDSLKDKNINESVWSDIQDRSTGEKERKEDEMTQDDLDAVDDFIFGFATRVVWDGVKDSLTNFLKYIDENPEALDCDIDRVKKYVEDNWHKGICDDVEAAIEQEYKEKEQDLNESVWSDIQDRSTSETVRKEDEMNDNDFLMLRETAKMFQVGVRNYANPKNRKYVPRRIDGQEGFIDYILERKNEHFWSDTPDETYDKVIKFVKDNWGDCTGIQDFMDKYLSNINECEGVPGGATPGCIGGMGPAYFPGADGTPGSGDLPSPTGIVYQQVAPFGIFIKDWKKKKKKKKKFRKEDEPCVHSPNKKVYNYVDDYREYVDRTYNNIDRRR